MGDILEFVAPDKDTLTITAGTTEEQGAHITLRGHHIDQEVIDVKLGGQKIFSIEYKDGEFISSGDPVKGAEVFADALAITLNAQGWTQGC